MTLSLEENFRKVLKDFNLSVPTVKDGFDFFAKSLNSSSQEPIKWVEGQLIPEVFNDCLMDPERPERESLLGLSVLYRDGEIERRLPDDLKPIVAVAVMVTAIRETRKAATVYEMPETTAKEFVRVGLAIGLLPPSCDNLFEDLARRVCEIADNTHVGIPVRPITIEVGIPFEELRDRILGRLSPELALALGAEYKRQNAYVIPKELVQASSLTSVTTAMDQVVADAVRRQELRRLILEQLQHHGLRPSG
jgi:hypothetical protein